MVHLEIGHIQNLRYVACLEVGSPFPLPKKSNKLWVYLTGMVETERMVFQEAL